MEHDESLQRWQEAARGHPSLAGGEKPVDLDETLPKTCSDDLAEAPETSFPPTYQIECLITRTGLSRTWKAFHRDTKTYVVVKEPLPQHYVDPEAADRFRHEVQFVAKLVHRHIVPIRETQFREPPWFYTMPYIEGDHLDKYCEARDLSVTERLRLFLKVCDAVGFAHQHGVIHRDLKPNNILVSDEGEPHLLDFGLGQAFGAGEEAEDVGAGRVMGSPGYMAPEQAAGRPGDTRTDVYALGVILYQLLTGSLPIKPAGGLHETLRRIQEDRPPNLRAVQPNVDRQLEAIVHKAVDKRSDNRYQTVNDLARDIERYLAGRPVAAVPPTTVYVLGRWIRRNWLPFAGGLAVVLVVAFLTVFAVHATFRRLSAESRSLDEVQKRLSAESRALDEAHKNAVIRGRRELGQDDPFNAAAALWAGYVMRPDDESVRFAFWEFYQRFPCLMAIDAGPIWDIEYSTTGRWLVGAGYDGSLRVLDASNGHEVQRFSGEEARAACVAFAPDGEHLYTGGTDGYVRVWRFQEKLGRVDYPAADILEAGSERVNCVAVSSDNRLVVAGMGTLEERQGELNLVRDSRFVLWRTADAEYRTVAGIEELQGPVISAAFSPDNTKLAVGMQAPHDGTQSTVLVFSVADNRDCILLEHVPHDADARDLRFSADGTRLFVAGRHLLSWEPGMAKMRQLELPTDVEARSVDVFDADGRCVIAAATGDGRIWIWDDTAGALLPVQGYHDAIRYELDVCFSPNGNTLASVGPDGLKLWCVSPSRSIRLIPPLPAPRAVRLSEDGSRVVLSHRSSQGPCEFVIWSPSPEQTSPEGKRERLVRKKYADPAAGGNVDSMALSRDGALLAFSVRRVGELAGTVVVVDVRHDVEVFSVKAEADWHVKSMIWPEAHREVLLLACSDGELRLCWIFRDVKSGAPPFERCGSAFRGEECPSVVSFANGQWLAACGERSREVAVWKSMGTSLVDRPFSTVYEEKSRFAVDIDLRLWRVAFARDREGNLLIAAAGASRDVTLWKVESGTRVGKLAGHSERVFDCVSLNERVLVTTSDDGTVRLWDVWEREEIGMLYSQPDLANAPPIGVRNGRIAISDGETITVADIRDIQLYIDGNEHFERQRLAAR